MITGLRCHYRMKSVKKSKFYIYETYDQEIYLIVKISVIVVVNSDGLTDSKKNNL